MKQVRCPLDDCTWTGCSIARPPSCTKHIVLIVHHLSCSTAGEQEAQSPFCWLCEHPQRLVVPQKMPGQRRIWRLPSKQMVAGMQRALKVRIVAAVCSDLHFVMLACT